MATISEILKDATHENRMQKLQGLTPTQLAHASSADWRAIFENLFMVTKNEKHQRTPEGWANYFELAPNIQTQFKLSKTARRSVFNRVKAVLERLEASPTFLKTCYQFYNASAQDKIKYLVPLTEELSNASTEYFPFEKLVIVPYSEKSNTGAHVTEAYPNAIFVNTNADVENKTIGNIMDTLFHEMTHLSQHGRKNNPQKYRSNGTNYWFDDSFTDILKMASLTYLNTSGLNKEMNEIAQSHPNSQLPQEELKKIYYRAPSEQEAYLCGAALQLAVDNLMVKYGMKKSILIFDRDILFPKGTDGLSKEDITRVVDDIFKEIGEARVKPIRNETGGFDKSKEPRCSEANFNPYHHLAWIKRVQRNKETVSEDNIVRHMLFATKISEFMHDGPGSELIGMMKNAVIHDTCGSKKEEILTALNTYSTSVNHSIAQDARIALNRIKLNTQTPTPINTSLSDTLRKHSHPSEMPAPQPKAPILPSAPSFVPFPFDKRQSGGGR